MIDFFSKITLSPCFIRINEVFCFFDGGSRISDGYVTTVKLNIRREKPNTRAAVVQMVPAGTELAYPGWTEQGEPINGNPRWYQDPNGNFFWSGGVQERV